MTMTPAELERKVRQVDNDVQSIYELLHGIKTTQIRHGNRLDELGQDFDRVNERLDGHDRRFNALDQRLGGHDQRFDALDQRLDGHDQRFDGLDAKMDEVLTLLRER